MSRFYKTSSSNPIEWAYELPYQEMLQGVLSKQGVQDQGVAQVNTIKAIGDNISYLKADRDEALRQVDWLNKGVDSFTNMDLTDPTNRAKLKEFSREASRRWGKSGVVGNIQNSVAARNSYLKSLQDNDKLTPQMRIAAMSHFDKSYKGVGDNTPYGGKYDVYQGRMLSNHVELMTEWGDMAKEVENDKVTEGGSSLAGMYIKDWEKYKSATAPEKMEMVWNGFLQRDDVSNYIQEGIQYGYMDRETLPQTLSDIYKAGFAQKGTEIKDTSKLKNNSWSNTKAGWGREDALIVDNYSDLYTKLQENGSAQLDGVTVKALIPDRLPLSDGLLFGGTGALKDKSPEDLETLKDMSSLIRQKAKNSDGKFSLSRLWSTVGSYGFGADDSEWKPTINEIKAYNEMVQEYATSKGISKEEAKERIKSVSKGLTNDQKKAVALASYAFSSNIPVTPVINQTNGARIVDNSAYISVNTEPVDLVATNLSPKEVAFINEQLGNSEKDGPLTLIPKSNGLYEVSISMNVKHDFSRAGAANFNKKVGGTYDARHQANFDNTFNYYNYTKPQMDMKEKYDNGDDSIIAVENEDGTIVYTNNPNK